MAPFFLLLLLVIAIVQVLRLILLVELRIRLHPVVRLLRAHLGVHVREMGLVSVRLGRRQAGAADMGEMAAWTRSL